MVTEYSIYYLSETIIYILDREKNKKQKELERASDDQQITLQNKINDYDKRISVTKAMRYFVIEFIFGNIAPSVIFTNSFVVVAASIALGKVSPLWMLASAFPLLGEIFSGQPKIRNEIYRLIKGSGVDYRQVGGETSLEDLPRGKAAMFADTIYLGFKEAVMLAYLLGASDVFNERFTEYEIPIVRYCISLALGIFIGSYLKAQYYPSNLPKSKTPFVLQQYESAKAVIFTSDFIINNYLNLFAGSDSSNARYIKVGIFSSLIFCSFVRMVWLYAYSYWPNRDELADTYTRRMDDEDDDVERSTGLISETSTVGDTSIDIKQTENFPEIQFPEPERQLPSTETQIPIEDEEEPLLRNTRTATTNYQTVTTQTPTQIKEEDEGFLTPAAEELSEDAEKNEVLINFTNEFPEYDEEDNEEQNNNNNNNNQNTSEVTNSVLLRVEGDDLEEDDETDEDAMDTIDNRTSFGMG